MDIRKLSEALQKTAEDELKEKPSRIKADIEHMKSWIAKQPHLNVRPGDNFLLTFLRGSKFSLERTKERLEFYYTSRTLSPEFYSSRDPVSPGIQTLLEQGFAVPLKGTNDKGERIIFCRIGCYDPTQTKGVDVMKLSMILADILLNEDDNAIVSGVQYYVDMKGGTMEHYTIFGTNLLAKLFILVQYAYPIRIKGISFVNAPTFFDSVYSLFKFVLTDKLKKRITVVKDQNVNPSDIPVKVLPNEYGGEAGPVSHLMGEWKKKVESYRDWILEDSKYRSMEEKRLGKPHTHEEIFGTEGSFRKLQID